MTDPDLVTLAVALQQATANLQQHIDDRAHEIAAPHIAASQASIAEAAIVDGRKQQRLEDLIAELRRQLEVQFRMADRYREWLASHGIDLLTGEKRI